MRRTLPLLLALALAGLAACDSSSGTPAADPFTCTDGVSSFAACGGDPTGDWTLESVCVSGEALFARTTMKRDCPQAKAAVAMDWTGTAKLHGGQIVFTVTAESSTTTLTIPDACLKGVACADAVTEPGYACTAGAAGTCVCVQAASGAGGPTETRAYTIDGTALVTTTTTGEERMDFCVKDGTLALQIRVGEDAPAGEYGSSSAPAVLVLRKD
jgi:hypothetical protein